MSDGGLAARAMVVLLALCTACSGDDESSEDPGGTGNVDFAVSCAAPPSCGGDPTGNFTIVGGCVQPSGEGFECDWESTAYGTVEGTASFDAGSYSIQSDADLRHCGAIDFTTNGTGTSYTLAGNTLMTGLGRTFVFCVEGDTLWLYDMLATFDDFNVLELERATQ
jgi:hypothetical protein